MSLPAYAARRCFGSLGLVICVMGGNARAGSSTDRGGGQSWLWDR